LIVYIVAPEYYHQLMKNFRHTPNVIVRKASIIKREGANEEEG